MNTSAITGPKRVLCAHLLDDFSGSSKVMAQAISALEECGHEVLTVVGSHGTTGFIRDTHSVHQFTYRFKNSKALLLISFAAAQWRLFVAILRHCRAWKPNVIYASTVLPAGAIFAAALCRIPVLVHIHEVGLGTQILFRFLIQIVNWGADRVACVSQYVAENLPLQKDRIVVLHNALSSNDRKAAEKIVKDRPTYSPDKQFTVLMACSLKWYKGIDSFLIIAGRLQSEGIQFKLVVNCEPDELETFLEHYPPPDNLECICRPQSVFDYYRTADLVVNLSHRDKCIESFGLTLLEAMACGIPVIAPQAGGCRELFKNGEGGWLIDSRDIDTLCTRISELSRDKEMWATASLHARFSAANFCDSRFTRDLHTIIQTL